MLHPLDSAFLSFYAFTKAIWLAAIFVNASTHVSLKGRPSLHMQEVTLQFPSIDDFFYFKHLYKIANAKANISQRTITSTLSHAEIEVAYIVFNATIIDKVRV
ncbi:MAG: hypothetical protein M3342_15275 [Bacteroidota bacterium]|nr:hypothetical protein [Flavisolibacter sp.]MBD0374398.1 hypothetical protein [Flavisolibacter sp.]MDQ3845349.1 hypothetical protein [Bacteroidota bacterium]